MTDVVSLATGKPAAEPVEAIVEVLEWLLRDARAGTLRGFAYVSLHGGHRVGSGWEYARTTPDDGIMSPEGHAIASGIAGLAYRFTRAAYSTY